MDFKEEIMSATMLPLVLAAFLSAPHGGFDGGPNMPPPPPAQHHNMRMDHGPKDHQKHGDFQRLFEHLDLTTEQRIKIDVAKAKLMEKNAEPKAKLDDLRKLMFKARQEFPLNREAIVALMDQIDALEKEVRLNKLDNDIAMYNILTAEQQTKLTEMVNRGPDHKPPFDRGCPCGKMDQEKDGANMLQENVGDSKDVKNKKDRRK